MSDATVFPSELVGLVGPYLERQDWYHDALRSPSSPAPDVAIESAEMLSGAWGSGAVGAGLARLVVAASGQHFQLVVGWRNPEAAADALGGSDSAIIGSVRGAGGDVIAYDALADEELLLTLLEAATGGAARAQRARVVESLTSHASVIYDDRLFMKLYRVLVPSPRREVEVMMKLDDAGFNHIVTPVAIWTRGGFDLAIVREFVSGALEGRALAVTSLRDLLGATGTRDGPPDGATVERVVSHAGGDLAGEMRRLGTMTARLHLALAKAFGESEADVDALANSITEADPAIGARIRAMRDVGMAIHVHGDYQLRRVMRTDSGWIVAGFGDDPTPSARLDPSRPISNQGIALEDVADMCHALREVARSVVAGYDPQSRDRERDAAEATSFSPHDLADAWVTRNVSALIDGYHSSRGIRQLVPRHPAAFDVLLSGLEAVRDKRDRAI